MTLQESFRVSTETVSNGGLNPLDWAIGMVVAVSVVSAFMRGLIRSVLSLAGLVLSVVLAAYNAAALARVLVRWIAPFAVAEIAAFVSIVLLTFAALSLLGHFMRRAAEAVGLGFFDRLAGAVFGAVRAVVLLSALALPLAALTPRFTWMRDSVLLPYLLRAAHGVSFVLPRDFEQRIAAGN